MSLSSRPSVASSRSDTTVRHIPMTLPLVLGLSTLLLAWWAQPLLSASRPQPVSPAGRVTVRLSERCPTLSWSQVPDALAYQVAIYRIVDGGENELVSQSTLPAGAGTWTPYAEGCLKAAETYAWAVRATRPEGPTEWSRAQVFEIVPASRSEVADSLEVLRRYLDDHRDNAELLREARSLVARQLVASLGAQPGSNEIDASLGSDQRLQTRRASEDASTSRRKGTVATNNYGIQTSGSTAGLVSYGGYYGVFGEAEEPHPGAFNFGVYGVVSNDDGAGVFGVARLTADEGVGVKGSASGTNGRGVLGQASGAGQTRGVVGESSSSKGIGVYGMGAANSGNNVGVYGATNSSDGFAGLFAGDVYVAGNLAKDSGSFKIDHPLDPANRYLSHSFVESPDMMNIYNGVVELDEAGSRWIELPVWFEALNRDFRYQLTPIGEPAPGLYLAETVFENRFRIAGGTPGAQVSWQVTGIRNDAYARAHPIEVEEDKGAHRGEYLHPELFGQPPERAIFHDFASSDAEARDDAKANE